MNYTINYRIISIHYNDKKRTTLATIVCEDTGEIFYGKAHRRKEDALDISLGANLAVARAVRKMVIDDLAFSEKAIKDNGWEFNFNC